MKKILLLVTLCATVLLCACFAKEGKTEVVPIEAPEQFVFEVVNETGAQLHSLSLSPYMRAQWSESLISDVLENKESCDIMYPNPNSEESFYDIRVTDKNGDGLEWSKIELAKAKKITLQWDGEVANTNIE